jgi:hypothetical protein
MLAAATALVLALLALVTPWTTIAPAYARPAILTLTEAMKGMTPVYLRYGDGLELLGYRLGAAWIHPGDTMDVTLVWRARTSMSENYTVGVHLLDGTLRDWGQIDMYPGRGNYATSLWQVGDIIRDTYSVRLNPSAPAPAMGRVAVGVQRYADETEPVIALTDPLPVTDELGQQVTPIFGRFKVAPAIPLAAPSSPVLFRLGQSLALTGIGMPTAAVQPGQTVQVRLTWQVSGNVGGDYTAFLHALNAGVLRFQADRPPLDGVYPTGLWEAGEVLLDTIVLPVPPDTRPGRFELFTGMYDPQTNLRLPAFAASGERLPNDAILLGEIQVARQ